MIESIDDIIRIQSIDEHNSIISSDDVIQVIDSHEVLNVTLTNQTVVEDTYTAGEIIGSGKVVYLHTNGKVYKADKAYTSQIGKIIGLTVTAVTTNNPVVVRKIGKLPNMQTLTIGSRYYLSTAGEITTTKPTTGFLCVIGIASDTNEIDINIESCIKLA